MASGTELNHVAFIPDGNNRWAIENNSSVYYAYRQGAERAKEAISYANDNGIHTATFWGLSTENWRHRPPEELDFLVGLFIDLADTYLEDATSHGVRIRHLGRKDRLPVALLDRLAEVERVTASNNDHALNLALFMKYMIFHLVSGPTIRHIESKFFVSWRA